MAFVSAANLCQFKSTRSECRRDARDFFFIRHAVLSGSLQVYYLFQWACAHSPLRRSNADCLLSISLCFFSSLPSLALTHWLRKKQQQLYGPFNQSTPSSISNSKHLHTITFLHFSFAYLSFSFQACFICACLFCADRVCVYFSKSSYVFSANRNAYTGCDFNGPSESKRTLLNWYDGIVRVNWNVAFDALSMYTRPVCSCGYSQFILDDHCRFRSKSIVDVWPMRLSVFFLLLSN